MKSYVFLVLTDYFNLQLKSFGAKLKERNNLFRKTSKVRSHEMKEVLYSSLVQANLVRAFKQKDLNTAWQLFFRAWRANDFIRCCRRSKRSCEELLRRQM